MKCFNHPETDAVGTCQNCGKAGCHECLNEANDMLLCGGCFAAAVEEHARDVAEERSFLKKRIRNSWLMAGLGALLGLMIAFGDSSAEAGFFGQFLAFAVITYLAWATYWGAIGTRPRIEKWKSKMNFVLVLPLMGWLFAMLLYVGFVLELALLYGALGGGIRQYLQHKRALAELSAEEIALAA